MGRTYLFIFYFVFCLSTPTSAAQIKDLVFPDQRSVAGTELILNGLAMRTFTFFDVYAAALYLDTARTSPAAILEQDRPRAMVMHFLRTVEKDKVASAWQEGLAANTPGASDSLRDRFAVLGTMMETMNPGETLECLYDPAAGTTVVVKGHVSGIIEGKDFNDALLACWIGPKPGPGEKFRTGLLGG